MEGHSSTMSSSPGKGHSQSSSSGSSSSNGGGSSSSSSSSSSASAILIAAAKQAAFWGVILGGAGFIYHRDLTRRRQGLSRRAPVEVVASVFERFDYRSTKKAAAFILSHRTTAYVAGSVAILLAAKYALYLSRVSKRLMRSFNPSPHDALSGEYPGLNDDDGGGSAVAEAEAEAAQGLHDGAGDGLVLSSSHEAGGSEEGEITPTTPTTTTTTASAGGVGADGDDDYSSASASSAYGVTGVVSMQRASSEPSFSRHQQHHHDDQGDLNGPIVLPPRRLEQGEIERFVRLMRHIVQGLPYEAILGIYGKLDRILLKAGDVLFKQGALALDGMYILVQGELGMAVSGTTTTVAAASSSAGDALAMRRHHHHHHHHLRTTRSSARGPRHNGGQGFSSGDSGGEEDGYEGGEDGGGLGAEEEEDEQDYTLLCSFGRGQTVGENALLASMAFSHQQQRDAAAAAAAGVAMAASGSSSATASAPTACLSIDCTRPLTCVAVKDTVVLRLDASVFRAFIDAYPHAITSFIMTTTTRQWRVAFYLLVDFFRLKDAWVASLEAPAHAPAFAFFDEMNHHHSHHQGHGYAQQQLQQAGLHFYNSVPRPHHHQHHGHGYGAAPIFQQQQSGGSVNSASSSLPPAFGLRKAPSAVDASAPSAETHPPRSSSNGRSTSDASSSSAAGATLLLRYPPPIPTNLRQFRSCCSAVLLKQPGETVYTEGSEADAVYVVLSGEGVCTVAERPSMVGPLLFSRQGFDPAENSSAAAAEDISNAHARHLPFPPASSSSNQPSAGAAAAAAAPTPATAGFVVRHIGPGCIAGGQACFVGLPHRDTLTAITLMEVAVFPRSLFSMLASNSLPEWHSPARTTTLASVALAVARSLVPLLRMFLGLGLQRLWLRSGEVLYRAGQHARDGMYVVVSGRLRTFLPQGGKASGRVGPTVAERAGVLEDGRLPWESLQAQGINAGPVAAAQAQAANEAATNGGGSGTGSSGSGSGSGSGKHHSSSATQQYFSRLAVQQRVFESDEVASAEEDEDDAMGEGDDDDEDDDGYPNSSSSSSSARRRYFSKQQQEQQQQGHHDYDYGLERSASSGSNVGSASSTNMAALSIAGGGNSNSNNNNSSSAGLIRSRGHNTIIRGRSRFGTAGGGPPHWSKPYLLHSANSAPAMGMGMGMGMPLPSSVGPSPNTSAASHHHHRSSNSSHLNASSGSAGINISRRSAAVPLPGRGNSEDDEDEDEDEEDDGYDRDEDGSITSPSADSADQSSSHHQRHHQNQNRMRGNGSQTSGPGVRFHDPPSPTTAATAPIAAGPLSSSSASSSSMLSAGKRTHLTATVPVPTAANANAAAAGGGVGGMQSPLRTGGGTGGAAGVPGAGAIVTPNLSFTRGFDVGRGDMVGEMSVLLQEKKRTDTAVCVRDCELICVSQAAFDLISSRYPAVARHFSQALARRYQELVGRSGGVAEGTAISLTSNGRGSGRAGAGGSGGTGNFASSLSAAAAALAANAISQAYHHSQQQQQHHYIPRPIVSGGGGGSAGGGSDYGMRGPGHRGGSAYLSSPPRALLTATAAAAAAAASAIPHLDDGALKDVATSLMETRGESISTLRLPASKTASPIITIAVAPAGTVLAAIPEFTLKLVAALERMGEGPVLHLTAARLDAALGDGTSYQLDDLLVRARVGSWLSVQEERHRFIVFETDAPLPPQNPDGSPGGPGSSSNALTAAASRNKRSSSSTLMRASSTVLDLARTAVAQSLSGATSGVASIGRGIDSALKAGLGVSPSMLFGPLQQQLAASRSNGASSSGANAAGGGQPKVPKRSTHWSELCIQQADLCLLVGRAHTPADLSPIEQECVYKTATASATSPSSSGASGGAASASSNSLTAAVASGGPGAAASLSPINNNGNGNGGNRLVPPAAAAGSNKKSKNSASKDKRQGGGRSGLPSNPFSSAADLLAMRNSAASKELAALSKGAQPRRGLVEAAAAAARNAELQKQAADAASGSSGGSSSQSNGASGGNGGGSGGASSALASTLHALSSRTFAVKELVLLHNDPSKRPSGTRDWLRRRRVTWHHHIRTPYEGDFDRLARHICGKARGLVLGGGGSRGLAHLGVLQVLQDRGVGVDVIGGTSQGAFMAACFATTLDVKSCFPLAKRLADTIGNTFNLITGLTLPIMSYFSGAAFNDAIIDCFKDTQIEDCWIRYFCVSTDVANDCSMVHQTGPLWRYCRASMTVLGLLPPLVDSRGGRSVYLIDGGYTNNLPVDVMRSIAPRVNQIIATDVENKDNTLFEGISDYGDSISGWYIAFKWLLSLLRLSPPLRIPPISEVSLKVSYISHSMQIRQLLQHADDSILYIRPDVGQRFKLLDYHLMPTIVECGMIAAKETLEKWDARQLAKTYRELKKLARQHLNAAMSSAHHQALYLQQQQQQQMQQQQQRRELSVRAAGGGAKLLLKNIGADTPTTVFAVADPSQFYHQQQQHHHHQHHAGKAVIPRIDEVGGTSTADTSMAEDDRSTTTTANSSLTSSTAAAVAAPASSAMMTFTLLSAMNNLPPQQMQQMQSAAAMLPPLHISAVQQQQQQHNASGGLYPQMPQQLQLQQSPHPLLGAAVANGAVANGAVAAVPFVPSVLPSVSMAMANHNQVTHARQPSAFPAGAVNVGSLNLSTPPSSSSPPVVFPSSSPSSNHNASALPLQVQRLRSAGGSTSFGGSASASTIGGTDASTSSSTNSLLLAANHSNSSSAINGGNNNNSNGNSSKDGASSGGGSTGPGSPSRGAVPMPASGGGRLSVTIPFAMPTTSASPHFGSSSSSFSSSSGGGQPPLTPRLGGMPASAALPPSMMMMGGSAAAAGSAGGGGAVVTPMAMATATPVPLPGGNSTALVGLSAAAVSHHQHQHQHGSNGGSAGNTPSAFPAGASIAHNVAASTGSSNNNNKGANNINNNDDDESPPEI